MSNAILRESGERSTKAVVLEFLDDNLRVVATTGSPVEVPYASLRIRDDNPARLIVGWRWSRSTLHLSGAAADQLRAVLPPSQSRWRRLGRMLLLYPRAALVGVALMWLAIDFVPAEMIERATPTALKGRYEKRLISRAQSADCTTGEGKAVLRQVAHQFMPGSPVPPVIVIQDYSFFVDARPAGSILMGRAVLNGVAPEVTVALLAREIAHLQLGHPARAAARMGARDYLTELIFADTDRYARLRYTRLEERAADRLAISMMHRSGIDLAPAAEFFSNALQGQDGRALLAREYATLNPITEEQAFLWLDASRRWGGRSLSPAIADGIVDACWQG